MRTVEKRTIVCDGSGAADVTLPLPPCVIEAIAIDRGTWGAAVDITFTDALTAEGVLVITNDGSAKDLWRPRTLVQSNTGADHASQVERPALFAGIRAQVAQATASTTGVIYFLIDR